VIVTAVSLPLIPLGEESGWYCTREPTKLMGDTCVYLVRTGVCGTISLWAMLPSRGAARRQSLGNRGISRTGHPRLQRYSGNSFPERIFINGIDRPELRDGGPYIGTEARPR
jgi:hypothetical protein